MNDNPLFPENAELLREEETRAARDRSDLALVLSTPEGRRVMGRVILDMCGLLRGSGAVANARDVGVLLSDEVRAVSPDAFLAILKECL